MKIDTRQLAPPAGRDRYAARPKPPPLFARTGRRPPSDSRKETLFSEFHSLLRSGIDFNRAFELLIGGEKEPAARTLLQQLHRSVIGGDTLASALAASGRFSPLDRGVVRIGEETGRLDEALQFLSDYYRKKGVQRRMISAAVSYPVIILCVAVLVLIFMMLVIVPMFEQVYARMGGELPGVTRAVIAFSSHFKSYALAGLLAAAAAAGLLRANRNSQTLSRVASTGLLKLPVVGEMLRMHYQSHFCKLMYLLYSSGVPLMQGVDMLHGIITFYPYRRSFEAICEELNAGGSFAGSVERFPQLYDRKLAVLLRVGEETNRLSEMLRSRADDLSAELEHRLKQLGTLLEPALIFAVGILVAVVLIAMYMPMFKLGTTIY
jgi:type IV pilus assembly protein PilC